MVRAPERECCVWRGRCWYSRYNFYLPYFCEIYQTFKLKIGDNAEQNQSFADFEDDGDHAYGLDAEAYPISQELDSMLEDVDYGSQLVAEPKKVKAIYLNYAKTAKRVDVRLLKENIWKELAFEDFAGKVRDFESLAFVTSS